ncbi:MAG: Gfo/Idh/MocA family oxidoreductase [Desulfobacterales bacterium]|nr:Gfo/Idh/MocA family oxidoreductase [Desulfobacterales bacterium]
MALETIRIGIVGAGGNTRAKHIPGFQALDDVALAGVCNRSRASSAAVAKTFGIPKVYDDWRQMVEDPAIDAVMIGTWPYMHALVTLAALEAGKHVLCEARMAMNAREAHAMLAAARARPQLVAQVVPSPFSLGVDRTIQRLLAEGWLGRLLAIDIRDNGGFIDMESPVSWRQEIRYSGVNTMMLGIWYEALMRWVGAAERVVAMGQVCANPLRSEDTGQLTAVQVPDHLDVIARMACGAQAHFRSTRVAGLCAPSHAVLYGSEATLRFESGRLLGGRRGDERLKKVSIPAEEAGAWRVEEEFIDAVRGRAPVQLTTFEDGVRYMEFTEAVIRSLKSGQAIHLPLGG